MEARNLERQRLRAKKLAKIRSQREELLKLERELGRYKESSSTKKNAVPKSPNVENQSPLVKVKTPSKSPMQNKHVLTPQKSPLQENSPRSSPRIQRNPLYSPQPATPSPSPKNLRKARSSPSPSQPHGRTVPSPKRTPPRVQRPGSSVLSAVRRQLSGIDDILSPKNLKKLSRNSSSSDVDKSLVPMIDAPVATVVNIIPFELPSHSQHEQVQDLQTIEKHHGKDIAASIESMLTEESGTLPGRPPTPEREKHPGLSHTTDDEDTARNQFRPNHLEALSPRSKSIKISEATVLLTSDETLHIQDVGQSQTKDVVSGDVRESVGTWYRHKVDEIMQVWSPPLERQICRDEEHVPADDSLCLHQPDNQMQHHSLVALQSWWRGTRVRRSLALARKQAEDCVSHSEVGSPDSQTANSFAEEYMTNMNDFVLNGLILNQTVVSEMPGTPSPAELNRTKDSDVLPSFSTPGFHEVQIKQLDNQHPFSSSKFSEIKGSPSSTLREKIDDDIIRSEVEPLSGDETISEVDEPLVDSFEVGIMHDSRILNMNVSLKAEREKLAKVEAKSNTTTDPKTVIADEAPSSPLGDSMLVRKHAFQQQRSQLSVHAMPTYNEQAEFEPCDTLIDKPSSPYGSKLLRRKNTFQSIRETDYGAAQNDRQSHTPDPQSSPMGSRLLTRKHLMQEQNLRTLGKAQNGGEGPSHGADSSPLSSRLLRRKNSFGLKSPQTCMLPNSTATQIVSSPTSSALLRRKQQQGSAQANVLGSPARADQEEVRLQSTMNFMERKLKQEETGIADVLNRTPPRSSESASLLNKDIRDETDFCDMPVLNLGKTVVDESSPFDSHLLKQKSFARSLADSNPVSPLRDGESSPFASRLLRRKNAGQTCDQPVSVGFEETTTTGNLPGSSPYSSALLKRKMQFQLEASTESNSQCIADEGEFVSSPHSSALVRRKHEKSAEIASDSKVTCDDQYMSSPYASALQRRKYENSDEVSNDPNAPVNVVSSPYASALLHRKHEKTSEVVDDAVVNGDEQEHISSPHASKLLRRKHEMGSAFVGDLNVELDDQSVSSPHASALLRRKHGKSGELPSGTDFSENEENVCLSPFSSTLLPAEQNLNEDNSRLHTSINIINEESLSISEEPHQESIENIQNELLRNEPIVSVDSPIAKFSISKFDNPLGKRQKEAIMVVARRRNLVKFPMKVPNEDSVVRHSLASAHFIAKSEVEITSQARQQECSADLSFAMELKQQRKKLEAKRFAEKRKTYDERVARGKEVLMNVLGSKHVEAKNAESIINSANLYADVVSDAEQVKLDDAEYVLNTSLHHPQTDAEEEDGAREEYGDSIALEDSMRPNNETTQDDGHEQEPIANDLNDAAWSSSVVNTRPKPIVMTFDMMDSHAKRKAPPSRFQNASKVTQVNSSLQSKDGRSVDSGSSISERDNQSLSHNAGKLKAPKDPSSHFDNHTYVSAKLDVQSTEESECIVENIDGMTAETGNEAADTSLQRKHSVAAAMESFDYSKFNNPMDYREQEDRSNPRVMTFDMHDDHSGGPGPEVRQLKMLEARERKISKLKRRQELQEKRMHMKREERKLLKEKRSKKDERIKDLQAHDMMGIVGSRWRPEDEARDAQERAQEAFMNAEREVKAHVMKEEPLVDMAGVIPLDEIEMEIRKSHEFDKPDATKQSRLRQPTASLLAQREAAMQAVGRTKTARGISNARAAQSAARHRYAEEESQADEPLGRRQPARRNQRGAIIRPKVKGPSNRKLILLALKNVCLAGAHLAYEHAEAKRAIDESTADHFVVLMGKQRALNYRGCYAMNPVTGVQNRIHGTGPEVLEPNMITQFYKYSTSVRNFQPLPGTKEWTATTDAVAVKPQFLKKKRDFASKVDYSTAVFERQDRHRGRVSLM